METLDDLKGKLDDIDEKGRGLTTWEIDFIDSLLKSTDFGIMPTNREIEIINRIYKEKVE